MSRHEFIRQLTLKLQSEARKDERFVWVYATNKSVLFAFDEDANLDNFAFLKRIEHTANTIFPGVPLNLTNVGRNEGRIDSTKADGIHKLTIDEQGHLWPLNE